MKSFYFIWMDCYQFYFVNLFIFSKMRKLFFLLVFLISADLSQAQSDVDAQRKISAAAAIEVEQQMGLVQLETARNTFIIFC